MTALPNDRRTARRPSGSEAWSKPRREEWRIRFFEEQVAFEAKQRRHQAALQRALFFGSIGGLILAGASLFFL